MKISGLKLKHNEKEKEKLKKDINFQEDLISEMTNSIKNLLQLDFKDSKKIDIYKKNIENSNEEIIKLKEILEIGYYGEYESVKNLDKTLLDIEQINFNNTFSYSSTFNTNIGTSYWNTSYDTQHTNKPKIYVSVKWLDEEFNTNTIYVYDDIFKSELNAYYLKCADNSILYLKKVINIDKYLNNGDKSKLYEWYETNNRNFIRLKKLENIIDEE